jgi:hypothetical protein
MGLIKPSGSLLWYRFKRLFKVTAWNSKLILGRLCFILLILMVVGVVMQVINNHRNSSNKPQKVTIASSETNGKINLLKNSTNIDDMINLKSQYVVNGDYDNALKIAKEIASKTQAPADYLEVLRICSLFEVPSKEAEIGSAVIALKPKTNNLTFRQAYSAGGYLEYAKHNNDAAIFYQQAYDTYDEAQKDPYTMSKVELKSHIGGL